jgi:transcription initiation factor TFIIIB Brf1 subunit/transcription initiation factor TFIIB
MTSQSELRKSVETHISKILAALGSNEDVRSMTMHLVKMAEKNSALESNNKLGEASGLVYIVGILTDNPVALVAIAEAAGISLETVRRFKTRLASELKTKDEWPGHPSRR